MTLKTLLNWGGLTKDTPIIPAERWHSDYGHDAHFKHHRQDGFRGKSPALSALALLAFLFLLHVMQNSLDQIDGANNIPNPPGTAVLLREENIPIILIKNDKETEKLEDLKKSEDSDKDKGSVLLAKGVTLG